MDWLWWAKLTAAVLASVWSMGFLLVFGFHIVALQMVTPGLAALRSAVWPITLATGWTVHGQPLPMD